MPVQAVWRVWGSCGNVLHPALFRRRCALSREEEELGASLTDATFIVAHSVKTGIASPCCKSQAVLGCRATLLQPMKSCICDGMRVSHGTAAVPRATPTSWRRHAATCYAPLLRRSPHSKLSARVRTASPQQLETLDPPSAPDAAQPQPGSNGSATFNWNAAWYPCAVISMLRSDAPNAFTLLGRPLVLWRDGSGTWHAQDDRCPHRCAGPALALVPCPGSMVLQHKGTPCC